MDDADASAHTGDRASTPTTAHTNRQEQEARLPFLAKDERRQEDLELPSGASGTGRTSSITAFLGRARKFVRAEYRRPTAEFFFNRSLGPARLGRFDMWSLAWASRLSSLVVNWETGVVTLGLGTALIGLTGNTIMFLCFSVVLAELATMLPYIGGLATYSRAAFGSFVGYTVGQCETAFYTVGIASNVSFFATVLTSYGYSQALEPLWWLLQMLILSTFILSGTRPVFIALAAFAIWGLLILPVAVLPVINQYDLVGQTKETYWTLQPDVSTVLRYTNDSATNLTTLDAFFPFGASGILLSFEPFSVGFTGLEFIPLLAEDAPNFVADAPGAILLSAATLIVQTWAYTLAFSGLPPGAFAMFNDLNGNGIVMPIASAYGLEPYGPAWNVLGFFFNYLTLSRTGYMPHFLSYTKMPFNLPPRPWPACVFTTFVVLVLCFVGSLELRDLVSFVLPNVSAALVITYNLYSRMAYILTCAAYLKLSHAYPALNRPWSIGRNWGRIRSL
ncbi:hypothetical protein HK101_002685 [Irineochytrium annulatum]|nr:hypothetical protein HK101_002685 [Irineochytrium annulatum]